ncbi:MAG: TrkA family potassium uptake protein [Bacilli bacterium]
MKKSFIVIGLGRFGLSIVKTLEELKSDVVAIDIDENAVAKAADYTDNCVVCDSTNKAALVELGVSNIDHAVVAIGNNLQATILTVINLSELGVKRISVRIDHEDYKLVMKRIGATDVIIPEEVSAISFANQIVSNCILEYYRIDKNYGIVKIVVGANYKPTKLVDMDTRNAYGVNIIGIIRSDNFIQPTANDTIDASDVLLVFGKTPDISKFEQNINK